MLSKWRNRLLRLQPWDHFQLGDFPSQLGDFIFASGEEGLESLEAFLPALAEQALNHFQE